MPHRYTPTRSAFTLVEMLVVVSVIAVLAGLLIPAVVSARHKAKTTECINNLRQLGIGYISYRDDYGELSAPPTLSSLFDAGMPMEGDDPRLMVCPHDVSNGKARRSGRPVDIGAWGFYEDLLDPSVEPRDISYFYETSGQLIGPYISGSTDWGSVSGGQEVGWFGKFAPLEDDEAYQRVIDEMVAPRYSTMTWGDYKALQRQRGLFGRGFPDTQFPVIRCFHHYPWPGNDVDADNQPLVQAVSWSGNTFTTTPFWEHDVSGGLIELPNY